MKEIKMNKLIFEGAGLSKDGELISIWGPDNHHEYPYPPYATTTPTSTALWLRANYTRIVYENEVKIATHVPTISATVGSYDSPDLSPRFKWFQDKGVCLQWKSNSTAYDDLTGDWFNPDGTSQQFQIAGSLSGWVFTPPHFTGPLIPMGGVRLFNTDNYCAFTGRESTRLLPALVGPTKANKMKLEKGLLNHAFLFDRTGRSVIPFKLKGLPTHLLVTNTNFYAFCRRIYYKFDLD